MTHKVKINLLLLSAFAFFVVFNMEIYQKEQILAHGERFYLELAPVDPRSLMQGDYMRLRYAIANEIAKQQDLTQSPNGYLVMVLDDQKIAHFSHFYHGETLAPQETLLRYRYGQHGVSITPDSFMFQEGTSQSYQKAKYGEFKTYRQNHLLVGLADEHRQTISPP